MDLLDLARPEHEDGREVVQAARNRLLLGWKIEALHEGVGKAKKLVETAGGAVARVQAEMTGTP
jgi:hypothetical protein